MKIKKVLWKVIIVLICLLILVGIWVLSINAYVVGAVKENIISQELAAELEDVDCIIVLGCLVRNNGELSDMLADRMKQSIELYALGVSSKILVSGDHGRVEYDEVNAMKQYAIDSGIPSEDIFMDHAGFSTYDSIYRAKEIFGADKIVIVTQEYHLYRALYIAKSLGIEAYGVSADYRKYRGQAMRDIREILARNKDFLYALTKPEPTYLGEPISLETSGDVTNDT